MVQVRWWLAWLGLRCRGTVCLETQSTQPPGWNQPAWVSRTLNSVAWTGCDILTVSSALKIQCSSTAFFLLEEIGGYVLECRGTLQVKVSRISSSPSVSGSAKRRSHTLLYLSKGKGDMVTYWLGGKRNHKDSSPDANASKQFAMETKLEGEPFSLLPGFLNEDLLHDSTWYLGVPANRDKGLRRKYGQGEWKTTFFSLSEFRFYFWNLFKSMFCLMLLFFLL